MTVVQNGLRAVPAKTYEFSKDLAIYLLYVNQPLSPSLLLIIVAGKI